MARQLSGRALAACRRASWMKWAFLAGGLWIAGGWLRSGPVQAQESSGAGFGPVQILSQVTEPDGIRALLESLAEIHEQRKELSGVLVTRSCGYVAEGDAVTDKAPEASGLWKPESESAEELALRGSEVMIRSHVAVYSEDAGPGEMSRVMHSEQSFRNGVLQVHAEVPIASADAAAEALSRIRKGEVGNAVVDVSRLPEESWAVVFMPEGPDPPLATCRFFPWTGVRHPGQKPISRQLLSGEVTECCRGLWHGVECVCVAVRLESGHCRLTWCPPLQDLIVFFALDQNEESVSAGKRLKERGLLRASAVWQVTALPRQEGDVEAVSTECSWRKAPRRLAGEKTEYRWTGVATNVGEENFARKLEIPEGTQVLHAEDGQILWHWQNGDINRVLDEGAARGIELVQFSPPEPSPSARFSREWMVVLAGGVIVAGGGLGWCLWHARRQGG